MHIMGIDPGFSGALAVLDDNLKIEFVMDMPVIMVGKKRELDEAKLAEVFGRWRHKPLMVMEYPII